MQARVVVPSGDGEDAMEVAVWGTRLLTHLEDVDGVLAVEREPGAAGESAKGVGAAVGALLAKLAGAGALKALVEAVRAFATRTGRTLEVGIDGDVLKLTGASREQQQAAMDAFLARHSGA